MSAVISLTTIPSRVDHMEPALNSLLRQGYPVYLWIQKETKRTGATLGELPAFLSTTKANVAIVEDRGPITKFLPAYEAGFDVIMTADDDHVYGPGWADRLIKWSEYRPGVAICYRGRNFDSTKLYNRSKIITGVHLPVDFITSVSGVIYRRGFFDPSISEEWKLWPMNDDIVVCAHLRKRGIPMEVVPFPTGCYLKRLPIVHVDAISKINVGGKRKARTYNDDGLDKLFWVNP